MKHEIRQVIIRCDRCDKEVYCAIHEGGCHDIQIKLPYTKIGNQYFCKECLKNKKKSSGLHIQTEPLNEKEL